MHDLIGFDDEPFEAMMWELIQSKPFQRLRRVKQLAFSEFVYPGATHTRFAHSIGVFHTARELMKIVQRDLESQERWDPTRSRVSLAAALLHDIGHGPFSHAFETVCEELELDGIKHEETSARIIRETEVGDILVRAQDTEFRANVASLIAADGPTDVYSSVVSSQFDADRLDYMRRDKMMTGSQHGEIDYTWLLQNLKIKKVKSSVDDVEAGEIETFVLDKKAYYAAETYVLSLFQLYPTIYFHKATRCMEAIFTQLLIRVGQLYRNSETEKSGLPRNHPIIRFFEDPKSLEAFLCLDDSVFWGAMPQLCEASDKAVQELATRLVHRKLWKTYDLRLSVEQKLRNGDEAAIDRVIQRSNEKISEWSEEFSDDIPRAVMSTAKRNPYKITPASASPLNKIFIENGSGLIELREVSPIVKAAKTFRLDRIYHNAEDSDVAIAISKAVDAAIKEEKNAT